MRAQKPKKRAKRKVELEWRYAAKLLFQFRVVSEGSSGVRRLCEERIIVFTAKSARTALREAKRRGRAAQHDYKNVYLEPVYFEFVGVMELLNLESVCEPDEVWYNLAERVRPMERRSSLIPDESQLSAIRTG